MQGLKARFTLDKIEVISPPSGGRKVKKFGAFFGELMMSWKFRLMIEQLKCSIICPDFKGLNFTGCILIHPEVRGVNSTSCKNVV